MRDAPPDWRHLSNILQELRSFDHRFRSALNFFESESAITNAIRSAEVAVRGRRDNGLSSLSSAFERIEKYLGAKNYVDISLNRVIIPDDGAVLSLHHRMNLKRLQMNPEIFPSSTSVTIPGSGAAGRFTDVQADLRGVETWIFKNALPPWWLEALVKQKPKHPQPQRDRAKRLLQKLFPGGLPSKEELPNHALLVKCKGSDWNGISPDTIERAADDLRESQRS
jgi:hypothetical protein